MTNPFITLESVSYVLPNGNTLFSDLNAHFDRRPTGLVGRNGVGKSLLAKIMTGVLSPTSGRCMRSGSVYYLAQQVSYDADGTVADLLGVRNILAALARIETGNAKPEDIDTVSDHWHIREKLRLTFQQDGLGQLDETTPLNLLSGGESMRVALMGAMLSDADYLILDEPSNHLDRQHRQALMAQLQQWSRGLLVISHDRQLLDTLTRIVDLSSLGLRSYGGNYAFYAQSKHQERSHALQQLEQRKQERQREEKAIRDQREKLAKRQAQGNRRAHSANQANILLGRQKERSENASGKHHQQYSRLREHLTERIRDAVQQVEENAPIRLHALQSASLPWRQVVELDQVELPLVANAYRHIHLNLTAGQRVGVVGANGCGKSTLLKVLAGQHQALGGRCNVVDEKAYIDQRLGNLDPTRTLWQQLREANTLATESELRMRLAQLGLDAQKIVTPSGLLSGGERIKGALACALYADRPLMLLLLDEPNNHLDLPSAQALEALLCQYRGTLLVVSHDDVFLDNLALTHRLSATEAGWCLAPW